MPNGNQGNARKFEFWVASGALNWGDRATGKAHTTIGLLWVALALYGLCWLATRVL